MCLNSRHSQERVVKNGVTLSKPSVSTANRANVQLTSSSVAAQTRGAWGGQSLSVCGLLWAAHVLAELHQPQSHKFVHLIVVAVLLTLPYEISRTPALSSSVAAVSKATNSNLYPCAQSAELDWSRFYRHVFLLEHGNKRSSSPQSKARRCASLGRAADLAPRASLGALAGCGHVAGNRGKRASADHRDVGGALSSRAQPRSGKQGFGER